MNVNLEDVINKIITETKNSKKEILSRIQEKKDELGGLITDEGAACIVAKDLGVEVFDSTPYKTKHLQIKDLFEGMSAVSIIGRVVAIFPIREFTFKSGPKRDQPGKRAKLLVQDQTGQILVVLWNEHTELLANNTVKQNKIIELKNAYIKAGFNGKLEMHLGKQGLIEPNPPDIDAADFTKLTLAVTKIAQITHPMSVNLFAKVQWKSEINTYEGGQVANLGIFDETGQTKLALWRDHAPFVERVEINDIVKLINAYTRQQEDGSIELNLGNDSLIAIEKDAAITIPDAPALQSASPPELTIKIGDITPESRHINLHGKVIEKADPRTVQFQDGSEHKVCEILLADETGCVSLSLWDEDIEKVQKGSVISIKNGYVSIFRNTMQLNAGKYGQIEPSDVKITKINRDKNLSDIQVTVERKRLQNLLQNERIEVLGTIVFVQEKKPFYDSCPHCNKKVTQIEEKWRCERCGEIPAPVPRMLWSFTLDDGTENIRVTVGDQVAEKLLEMTVTEARQMVEENFIEHYPLLNKSKDLLGKKILVKGDVRYSDFTKELELRAIDIQYPDPKEEALRLLARIESSI